MVPCSVVVSMQNTNNFSVVEIDGPRPSQASEKERAMNLRQFRWSLCLRIQRVVSCLLWFVVASLRFLCLAWRRLIMFQVTKEPQQKGRLLMFLRALLLVSIVVLVVETYAQFFGWNLDLIHPTDMKNLPRWAYMVWLSLRADFVAPLVIFLSKFCTVLFLVQSLDRFAMCFGCFWIKFKKLKPKLNSETHGKKELSTFFPMVLVQIPMCNEREVYKQSIAAVCQLDWPQDHLLIQVLDDSDIEAIQLLIRHEVSSWRQKGVNIVYRHRLIRTGYKAGNLKSAMACDYVKDYEFVAIFDADFQPNPNFLMQTIPHFEGNPELALVQARWSFVNSDENLLTRLQNINLTFHFEVEQQVNGVFLNFFGFNGTAGVWRIKALEESGGWLERTTVEDMDIAVRAHLKGWKFIFLNDVKVLCELPESYEVYKKQQYRWHSGPMQLFRLCLPNVITSKLSIWKKFNLIFLFFLLRKLILPLYSFTLFCVILPLTMFVPEAELPLWAICYVPVLMSLLNILPSPKSFPFLIPYLLFENTMSVTKFHAMVSGLFQLGSSYEWVVTKKAGRSSSSDLIAFKSKALNEDAQLHKYPSESELEFLTKLEDIGESPVAKRKRTNRLYRKELALSCLLLSASVRSLLSAHGVHFYFLLFQGLSFLIVGLDLIGEQSS